MNPKALEMAQEKYTTYLENQERINKQIQFQKESYQEYLDEIRSMISEDDLIGKQFSILYAPMQWAYEDFESNDRYILKKEDIARLVTGIAGQASQQVVTGVEFNNHPQCINHDGTPSTIFDDNSLYYVSVIDDDRTANPEDPFHEWSFSKLLVVSL